MADLPTLDQVRQEHRRQVVTPGVVSALAALAMLFVFGGLNTSISLYDVLYFPWIMAASILVVLLVAAVTETQLRAIWSAIAVIIPLQTLYVLIEYRSLTAAGALEPDSVSLFALLVTLDGTLLIVGFMAHGLNMAADRLLRTVGERLAPLEEAQAALQSQLQTSRARVDALFQHAGSAVILVGRDGRVVRVNRGFEELTGYRSEMVLDWSMDALARRLFQASPSDLENYRARLSKRQVVLNQEMLVIRADGSQCPVEMTAVPFRTEDRLMVVIRDVSVLLAAESERHSWLSELTGINEISTAVNSSLQLDEVLSTATTVLSLVAGMEIVAIQVRDVQTGELKPATVQLNLSGALAECLGDWADPRSILGRVFGADQRVIVESLYDSDDPEIWRLAQVDVNALICMPLTANAETVGVMTLASRLPQQFTNRTTAVLTNAAREIGTAIRNAALYESERRQRRLAESQHRLAEEVSRSLNRQDIFCTIAHQFRDLTGAERSILMLLDAERAELSIEMVVGRRTIRSNPLRFSCHEIPFWDQFIREGCCLIMNDVPALGLSEYVDRAFDAPRSMLTVPLRRGEEIIGCVAVVNKCEGPFTQQDAGQLETLAASVAVAIQNADLFEAVSEARDLLDARVKERTAELTKALAAAKEADQFKLCITSLAASVSPRWLLPKKPTNSSSACWRWSLTNCGRRSARSKATRRLS
ncbi:MAG: GAF domain-containing protein [Anaerolineae bacterium]|nr:GAF domain-containing protein [Anaerolineae bacterium]